MNEIVKINNKQYNLVTAGIGQGTDSLLVRIKAPAETLEETEGTFSSGNRIEVENDDGELLSVYNGYSKVTSISKVYGQVESLDGDGNAVKEDVVSVVLEKPSRIDALEDAVDALTMAFLSDKEETEDAEQEKGE